MTEYILMMVILKIYFKSKYIAPKSKYFLKMYYYCTNFELFVYIKIHFLLLYLQLERNIIFRKVRVVLCYFCFIQ